MRKVFLPNRVGYRELARIVRDDVVVEKLLALLGEVEQRVQGGGVVVESVADRARVVVIERQKLPKITPCQNGGEDGQDIYAREDEEVAEFRL